jgi:hypothetical protein
MDKDTYIQYGAIVKISDEIKNDTYFVDYIDNTEIILVNEKNVLTLKLNEDGTMVNKNIKSIVTISNPLHQGYALQNNLIVGIWIDIHYDFDIDFILTGLITNVEYDMIELSIWNSTLKIMNETLYIDFEYKGLSKQLRIKKIVHREIPDNYIEQNTGIVDVEIDQETEIVDSNIEIDQENIRKALQVMYISSKDIIFNRDDEKITERIEKREIDKRYSLESQTTDILDEILSVIPNYDRTPDVLDNINRIIERFTQLRENFSIKDENGFILCSSLFGMNNKPLANLIYQSLYPKWVLPTTSIIKKLYTTQDEVDTSEIELISLEKDIKEQYKIQRKYFAKSNKKYSYKDFMKEQDIIMIPFTESNDDNVLKDKQNVKFDQEGIINGSSNCFKKSSWNKSKNINQRFNTGETMNVTSIIMLPRTFVEFTKLNLPVIDIMTRSSLNNNYISIFEILGIYNNKKNHIETKKIERFEEINFYENKRYDLCPNKRPRRTQMSNEELKKNRKLQKLNTNNFIQNTIHYILDKDNGIEEDRDKFEKFIYTIIPTTYELLKLIPLNFLLLKNYSFVEIVNNLLGTFMIDSKNIQENVESSGGEFGIILGIMKNIMKVYVQTITIMNNNCAKSIYQLERKKNLKFDNAIDSTIISNNGLNEIYEQIYILNTINFTSSSEKLSNIMSNDEGNTFCQILYAKNDHLNINPTFVDDVLLIKADNECKSRFIAKKYKSLSELEQDNRIDILYYDLEYDILPYHLMKNFTTIEKLQQELIINHFCSKDEAINMAKSIKLGKQIIRNGEYAVLSSELILVPRYFKRNHDNNIWIEDKTLNSKSFLNNNDLFCNISNKCIKNTSTHNCESLNEHKNVYATEFKKRLDEMDTIMKFDINTKLEKQIKYCNQNKILKHKKLLEQNMKSLKLGKSINTDITVKSPFSALRDNIITYQDINVKHKYIITFVNNFTRPSIEPNESPFWLYCKESNTKLLPLFMYDLAIAFNEGTYETKLREIIDQFGETDSDGMYFDIESGYRISNLDFTNNEEYNDAGSIITSYSIVPKDDVEKDEERNHKSSSIVDTIFSAICKNLNLQTKLDSNFIVKKSLEIIDTLEDEQIYNRKIAYLQNQNKSIKIKNILYKDFYNQNIIYIVSSLIFITIQTSIPSIKVIKTFEECIKSFTGYPMKNNVEDESGIEYMACVVLKLGSSITPWQTINKVSPSIFKKNLKQKISLLMLNKEIDLLYETKLKNDSSNVIINIQNIDSINKWVNVLPPILPFSVKDSINDMSKGMHSEFTKLVGEGHKSQRNYFEIYRSKVIMYGYGIIELINDIVKKKELLLNTGSNIPYLQNACCKNEISSTTSTLDYFINENDKLLNYIDSSSKCELVLSDMKDLTTPPFLIYDENTSKKKHIKNFVDGKQSEVNLILAFNHYLKLNEPGPTPFRFSKLFSIKDKEDKYDNTNLDNVLKIVFDSNLVLIKPNIFIDSHIDFENFINDIVDKSIIEKDIVDESIIEKDIVDDSIIEKDSFNELLFNIKNKNKTDDFKIYLSNLNANIKEKILEPIHYYLPDNQKIFWEKNLSELSEWTKWNIFQENKTNAIPIIKQYIKNAVNNMINTYPSMIINKVTTFQPVTKRWKFAPKHIKDIENYQNETLYTELNKFNFEDDGILFSTNREKLQEIIAFLDIIPNETTEKYDDIVYQELYTYCLLSVFYIYLIIGDNEIKERTIELLTSFLHIEVLNKLEIDKSSHMIEKDIFKSRETEKKSITDMLGGLNKDERMASGQLKKYNLGTWGEGKLGLVKYNPLAYDKSGLQIEVPLDLDEPIDDTKILLDYDEMNENVDGYDNEDGDGNNNDDDDNNDE